MWIKVLEEHMITLLLSIDRSLVLYQTSLTENYMHGIKKNMWWKSSLDFPCLQDTICKWFLSYRMEEILVLIREVNQDFEGTSAYSNSKHWKESDLTSNAIDW